MKWLRENAGSVELPTKDGPGTKALATVIHEAVLAEREACAKEADDGLSSDEIAAAIRART